MSDVGIDFTQELGELIKKYRFRLLSNAEAIGILHIMADDLSQKLRNEQHGPSERS